MRQQITTGAITLILVITVATACVDGGVRIPGKQTATQTITANITSEPTDTPPRELTICLGEEPASLFIYAGEQTAAMWSVLEAVYDGPIDLINGRNSAVILQKVPSYADGDLIKTPVDVEGGELVVDAHDHLVVIQAGTFYLPAGCSDHSCGQVWDGVTPIKMDQVSALYKLRTNLSWSDGMPLTASDSLYSYMVASNPSTGLSRTNIERTYHYEVVDEVTIRWMGVPGFQTGEVTGMFWIPLPEHILGGIPMTQLAGSEMAARKPLGWGPYVIQDWVEGDHISLSRNVRYFRSGEGLPKYDRLTYRFIDPQGGKSLAALAAGQCDLIERSSIPQSDTRLVEDLLNNTHATEAWTYGPEITQLVLGLKPATYDNGYNHTVDRPDYFGLPAVRSALVACIDRQALLDEVFEGHAAPASLSDLLGNQSGSLTRAPSEYDPDYARQLLDQSGWLDSDGDPSTPRVAVSVPGVTMGTPLSLTLWTPADRVSVATGSVITRLLAGCGIQVKPSSLPFTELFAPGPEGLIFGRSFDLVLITWQYSQLPACQLYMSSQIPTQENYWIGGNVSGYTDPDFGVACSALIHTLPGDVDFELTLQEVVKYFSEDMPAIPLFMSPKLMITGPGICPFQYYASARSDLTNLELIDEVPACVP
ncbi:MAG: hypothetical protein JXR32_06085 [Anaerolineaceae bacterium]|nr:hypothetical protein [Anaerolineaceae bacterium]